MAKLTRASWDWKEDNQGIRDALEKALEPFGITVFMSDSLEGSDCFGFVFSDDEDVSESEFSDAERFFDDGNDDSFDTEDDLDEDDEDEE